MTGDPGGVALALVAAREAWPTLEVPNTVFAAFLEARQVNLTNVTSAITQDLYLACACLHGTPGALSAFAEKFSPTIRSIARRFNSSPSFGDDVEQQLNEVLFVGGVEGARIGRYVGGGALLGFVGTAARRIALRQVRAQPTFQGEEDLVEQFADVRDHEMDMLKDRYRMTFNKALPIALRQLPRRDRLILRMNVVERVSTTKIASIYRVSQPTVSRWIQSAASRIFAVVKELVCEELEIDTKEMGSLLTLVRSQIDLTLSHAIGDTSITSPR
jgi:RNA polymerase sigma-70 factor, ECF subfamily